jgi:hypothetical protein
MEQSQKKLQYFYYNNTSGIADQSAIWITPHEASSEL